MQWLVLEPIWYHPRVQQYHQLILKLLIQLQLKQFHITEKNNIQLVHILKKIWFKNVLTAQTKLNANKRYLTIDIPHPNPILICFYFIFQITNKFFNLFIFYTFFRSLNTCTVCCITFLLRTFSLIDLNFWWALYMYIELSAFSYLLITDILLKITHDCFYLGFYTHLKSFLLNES